MRRNSASSSIRSLNIEKVTDQRNAGILFSLGGLLFLLLSTVSEATYPGFSLQTNAISDMAALGARTSIIEEAAILGLGICWSLGAYYLFRNTGRRGTMVLNLLPGTGFLLAGLSPENVNITIHSIGAFLAFPFGATVVIMSYKTIRSQYRYFSVILGVVAAASTFVTFFGGQLIGPCSSCAGAAPGYIQSLQELALGLGGWESMIIYPLLMWLIGFGSYLLMASDQNRGQSL